jgi:hypothetical protein
MLASCYPGVSSRESPTSAIVLQIAATEMTKGKRWRFRLEMA